jgi:hypothetical protein
LVALLVEQDLTATAFHRLAIATSLVSQSLDSLMVSTDIDPNTIKVTQALAVALYELEQLAQDLDSLL